MEYEENGGISVSGYWKTLPYFQQTNTVHSGATASVQHVITNDVLYAWKDSGKLKTVFNCWDLIFANDQ